MKGLGMILLAILACALLIAILFMALQSLMILDCNGQTKDIGLPHRYSFFGGCQIHEDGNWIPLENWRYFGNK
jgi:hypothetical protein